MHVTLNRACPQCSGQRFVLMRRLDTGLVFAECLACETGFAAPDLEHAATFSTHDVYWERSAVDLETAWRAGWRDLAVGGQLPSSGATPTPEVVAAWFVLDRLPLEKLPWWAADWLADGLDGEMLRKLAGEHGDDPLAVKDLVGPVLQELNVPLPADTAAAVVVAFTHLATECLAGRVPERDVAAIVDHLVSSAGYDSAVLDLPLGQTYGIDDEWTGGWGRLPGALARDIRTACEAQVEAPGVSRD